jgi:hypothetical protein
VQKEDYVENDISWMLDDFLFKYELVPGGPLAFTKWQLLH